MSLPFSTGETTYETSDLNLTLKGFCWFPNKYVSVLLSPVYHVAGFKLNRPGSEQYLPSLGLDNRSTIPFEQYKGFGNIH